MKYAKKLDIFRLHILRGSSENIPEWLRKSGGIEMFETDEVKYLARSLPIIMMPGQKQGTDEKNI